ncbi:hypothetical protein N7532_000857 [Penicillium argentinense]|uniref:Uncharacterized protein n=1 Tax=Penicillium argentinense TaxID=1131581 RepID=A0A9W9G6B8_9EURO|nr:uncharacterized protein N7532_000857 [Penicillium argentinense]KAJ5112812.1 hypothetical protein N7532_000857 [Penicillium argentinense]
MGAHLRGQEGPTPANACARHDRGGGVRLGDAFAIYSIVASAPNWSSIQLGAETLADLNTSLSAIQRRLPILTTLQAGSPELVSLPCPSRQHERPEENVPWFLINAAASSQHCLLGQHNALETMLMVLQRPWCVLELCCCDTDTVTAAHAFALIATCIDRAKYQPAVRLLSDRDQRTQQAVDMSQSPGLITERPSPRTTVVWTYTKSGSWPSYGDAYLLVHFSELETGEISAIHPDSPNFPNSVETPRFFEFLLGNGIMILASSLRSVLRNLQD